jgi:hypothetical protein
LQDRTRRDPQHGDKHAQYSRIVRCLSANARESLSYTLAMRGKRSAVMPGWPNSGRSAWYLPRGNLHAAAVFLNMPMERLDGGAPIAP